MRLLTLALLTLTLFTGCYNGVHPTAGQAPVKRFKVVTIANGQTNVVYLTAKRTKQSGRWFFD